MTTISESWTEQMVDVAGTKLQLVKGGSGKPLLILHDEMGHSGLAAFPSGSGTTLHPLPSVGARFWELGASGLDHEHARNGGLVP